MPPVHHPRRKRGTPTPREAEALELRDMGLLLKEVASRMGISITRAGRLVSKARWHRGELETPYALRRPS